MSEQRYSSSEIRWLEAAVDELNAAIAAIMQARRPGWADDVAKVRDAIERDLRGSSSQSDCPRFPPDDLRVDFGEKPPPGSLNPTPPEVRAAYEERILASVEAQNAGARLAATLFVGGLGY